MQRMFWLIDNTEIALSESNSRRFNLVVVMLALLLSCIAENGQANDEVFFDGPISENRSAVNDLVRLTIQNGKITVRRDWKNQSFTENQDETAAKIQNLIKQGMNAARAEQLIRRVQRNKGSNPLSALFNRISGTAPKMSSRSSVSSRQISAEFATLSLKARLLSSESTFELFVQEVNAPKRKFVLRQNKQFLFQYSGDEFDFILNQFPDGKVRFTVSRNGNSELYESNSYDLLISKHSDIVRKTLLPVFEHLGIGLPLTSDNHLVKDAVRMRLIRLQQQSHHEFQAVISMLDSDEFSQREKATRQLRNELEKWLPQIETELQNPRSAEVRYRLLALLRGNNVKSEIDTIIDENQLLESTEYLVNLFDGSNEQQSVAIASQLEQLTGHRKENSTGWKNWFNSKKKNASK